MSMPPDSTPLFKHPLPMLELWLEEQGCNRDRDMQNRWYCDRPEWKAELTLEETTIDVQYTYASGETKTLSFPYSLSRQDLDAAIFEG